MASEAAELTRIMAEQNPWHRDGQVPAALAPTVERPLAQQLWHRVLRTEPRRFSLVLGARRVGKTTAMYQTVRALLQQGIDAERLWWLRLDHPILLRQPLGDLVQLVLAQQSHGAPVFLFLDELVYAQDWDLWLKTFYDEHWPVQVLGTSSATAALRGRRLESGVGRWTEHYLSPYSFAEFLDLLHVRPELTVDTTLDATLAGLPTRLPDSDSIARRRRRFLVVGGFPELLRAESQADEQVDDANRLLESQQTLRADAVERAVYKDIPQSYGVDNPMALERLLYVLAAQVTGIFSPSKAATELGLTQPTVDRYLGYLEQAFLTFQLPNYSGNENSVQRRGRKIYFVDGAVRNAALQRGLAPLDDPAEMGLLLENAVAASLHGLAQHTGQRLYHWRDGKHEVDLVLDDPQRPLAFEVGSSPSHARAGLQALVHAHPRFDGGAYVVAPGAPVQSAGRAHDGIGSVPLDMFLLAVGAQAAQALAATLATGTRRDGAP